MGRVERVTWWGVLCKYMHDGILDLVKDHSCRHSVIVSVL